MITNERCLRSQRHVKANQDIIGEHCIRNEEEMCRVSEEYKKLAWKSYHRELQKTEPAWEKNILSLADFVSGLPRLIGKDRVERQSVK